MPIGSSTSTYNLEFIASLRGGNQVVSGINQINSSVKTNAAVNQQSAKSIRTVTVETDKATKSLNNQHQRMNEIGNDMSRRSRDLKALAFGMIGLTSAGVEAIGMWSMYSDVQKSVEESQQELNEAIKTYGEDSTQANRATQELAKAERFRNMTLRNLMLSMFDMVPFTLLTINALVKLKTRTLENKAAEDLLTASITRQIAAARGSAIANAASATTFQRHTIALGTATAGTEALTRAKSRLATIGGTLLRVLGPIAVALGAGAAAALLYKNNIGGARTSFDKLGISIGNTIPQAKGLLNTLKDLALAFPDVGAMWDVITGNKGATEAKKKAEALEKAIQELNESSAEYVLTLAEMEKKERKGALFDLGIKGGTASRVTDALKRIDNIREKVTGFSQAMQAVRQFDIWKTLGLKDLPGTFEKIFFTFEDRFDDISKMFKKGSIGRKLFSGLEETMRDAAKNPGEAPKIISKYLANHPEIIKYLEQMGFSEEAAFLKAQADEALKDWWKKGSQFENKNPVTKGKIIGDQLPDWFRKQFPSTIDQKPTEKLPPLQQDVTVNLLGAARGGGTSTITDLPGFVAGWLQQNLFNAGAWHDAITRVIPTASQGIMTDVWNQFASAVGINNIQPIIDFNNNFNATVDSILNDLFNAGAWHDAINTFMSTGATVQGILTDVWNQFTSLFSGQTVEIPAINIGEIQSQVRTWLGANIGVPITNAWNAFNDTLKTDPTMKAIGEFFNNAGKWIQDTLKGLGIIQEAEGAEVTIVPVSIDLQTDVAQAAITKVSKWITDLTQILPQINLQNKKAIKANDVVAKRIDSLEKIKPQINLQNNKAIKAVDVVAKRINSLSDLSPTVNVKVNYTGVRSFAKGGSFMTSGPELIMVGDNPSGKERVSVTPMSGGGSTGGGNVHGGDTIHIHNHLYDREILQTYQRNNGRLMSRFGSRGSL